MLEKQLPTCTGDRRVAQDTVILHHSGCWSESKNNAGISDAVGATRRSPLQSDMVALMLNLESTLREYEPVMLGVIAARWDVDLETYSVTDITALLLEVMLDPEAAAATWDRLDDAQRGAMQSLLGAKGTMPARLFSRLYGEIREMGPGKLEREKPYRDPQGISEVLFYRGLIARGYQESDDGPVAVIYVPIDLAAVLPVHHTGFDLSADEDDDIPFEDDEDEADEAWEVAADQPDEIIAADTSIIDDLTTLLAYVQVAAVAARDDNLLPEAQVQTLNTFLLKPGTVRLHFLLGLARSLNLIAARDGLLKPVSQNARRWLEAPRSEQVRTLAAAWLASQDYNDLCHVPGLAAETVGNDPRQGRAVLIDALRDMPLDSWWVVDGLVDAIKQDDPDFQRPGGDYESWYIRDERTDEYLSGFDHWDQVDGALLRFIILGPLHWLGLADVGRYAGGNLGRLNAYGRAFVSGQDWPKQPETPTALVLHDDGTAEADRRLSRYDRFQLARFTEWLSAGDVYRYRFSVAGLRRASIQGIETKHVRAYLTRTLQTEQLPEIIETMLGRWAQTSEADASIEQVTILRTASPAALETVLDEPSIRRYLGARLGPEAVLVRKGQAAALQHALAAFGVLADMIEE
ncbi:helicase-associated domain-containing protein [Chloroflexota bacterium]